MARKKLLHIKSSSIDNGAPKLPTANQIEYGEIAVNYGDGVETLSIKNSANEIITFSNDKTLLAYIDGQDKYAVDDTMTKSEPDEQGVYTLGVKIDDALDLTSKYPVSNSAISTVIKEDEEVVAAALNDLNARLGSVSGDLATFETLTDELVEDIDSLSGQIDTNTTSIAGLGQSKQDKLTAGTGIDITENVISCTLDTQISEFVNELPTTGNTNKIYFVPNADTGATSGNTYIEYAWHVTGATQAEGEWEKLGEWTPSLTIDDELDLDSVNPVQNAAISSAMTRIELVTSSALNDLDTRTAEISGDVLTISSDVDTLKTRVANTYTKPEIDAMVDDLEITIDEVMNSGSTNPLANSAITMNFDRVEKVTAAALNELNNKALELSGETTSLRSSIGDIETSIDGMEPLVVTATGDSMPLNSYSTMTITNGVTYSEARSALESGRRVCLRGNITLDDLGATFPIVTEFDGIAATSLVGDSIVNYNMMSAALDNVGFNFSIRWDSDGTIRIGYFPLAPDYVYYINDQELSNDINSITLTALDIDDVLTGVTVNNKTAQITNKRATVSIGGSDIKLSGYTSPANNTDSDPILSGYTVNQAFSKVISAITDNEEVTSAAINELDARITTVSGDLQTVSGDLQTLIDNPVEPMVEVTYSELVALKSGGELAAGSWYRITDYQCTTTQTGTSSANHPFDIIVLALSDNTLSEDARAIQHEGDTYFAKSKLNAWQLKYSLENDKAKYGWADTVNGKGVVWYMKDEWNNECGYDFKNIMFTRALTNGVLDNESGTDTSVYTFNGYLGGSQMDLSNGIDLALAGGSGYITMCAENIIKSRYDYLNQTSIVQGNGLMLLNDNVFLCSANTLAAIGYLYVFGNVFGEDCFQNTLDGFAEKNVFGENCSGNTFGKACSYNMFGDNCNNNSFGFSCNRNTFGSDCNRNDVGDDFSDNTFGDDCDDNVFGIVCYGNVFGNNCIANTFGNEYRGITFGSDCTGIRFGTGTTTIDNVRYIQVENGVQYVDITTTATTSSSECLQNITISQGVSGSSLTQKTITHPTVGDTFQTIYRPANSQIVSV